MNIYNTDTKMLTCSCKDWEETRSIYSMDDPRRLCKHIINKLDINNLPLQIKTFKESIEFYQNKEYGFTKDFEKIIKFPITKLTVLLNYDWMNIFDSDGNEYGYLNDSYTGNHHWSGAKKPVGYEEIESFFKKKYDSKFLGLQGKEKSQLIQFIKTNIPSKQDVNFSFQEGYSELFKDVSILYLEETKNFVSYYEENEDYKINFVEIDKYNITLNMKNGNNISYKRDYDYAMAVKEEIRVKQEAEKLIHLKQLNEERQKYEEELYKKRQEAKAKGYLWLVKDSIYREAITICNLDQCAQYTEHLNATQNISLKYKSIKELLETSKTDINLVQFNISLKKMGFVKKVKGLNLNDWIVVNDGLKFGINLEKDSKYFSETIPEWYQIKAIHPITLELVNLTDRQNIRMTKVMWEKNKFIELLELVLNHNVKKEFIVLPKQQERNAWLKYVSCPNCSSKNIHKKNKRIYGYGTVQRYQCMDCKSIFQEKVDENLAEEENNIENINFTADVENEQSQNLNEKNLKYLAHAPNAQQDKKSSYTTQLFDFIKKFSTKN